MTKQSDQTIVVTYSAVDGARKVKTCKTLTVAQTFAATMVGETPDIGRSYAMSWDGVGKVSVTGCTLSDLFPTETPEATAPVIPATVAVAPPTFAEKMRAAKLAKAAKLALASGVPLVPETAPAPLVMVPAIASEVQPVATVTLPVTLPTAPVAPAFIPPVSVTAPSTSDRPGKLNVLRVMLRPGHYHYFYTSLDGTIHCYETKKEGVIEGALRWTWLNKITGEKGVKYGTERNNADQVVEMFVRRELIALGQKERADWRAANTNARSVKTEAVA